MSFQSRISDYSFLSSKSLPEFQVPLEIKKDTVVSAKDGKKILFPCINILDDVVLKKTNKKGEFENLKFFSDKVLEQVSEHFPLVYRHETTEDNTLIMMEKFEGDFNDIDTEEMNIDEIMSFFLQMLMALYAIDSYGKFHGDLNPGNALFKKIDDSHDIYHKGYLKYVIGKETYYLKHFNRLWVIADFEYMGNKGEVLETSDKAFDTTFFKRLFGDLYDKIKEPVRGSWMYDMYVIAHFTYSTKIAERLFNFMQDGFSLNPIDAIPYIIKNEISHIFIRGELS